MGVNLDEYDIDGIRAYFDEMLHFPVNHAKNAKKIIFFLKKKTDCDIFPKD